MAPVSGWSAKAHFSGLKRKLKQPLNFEMQVFNWSKGNTWRSQNLTGLHIILSTNYSLTSLSLLVHTQQAGPVQLTWHKNRNKTLQDTVHVLLTEMCSFITEYVCLCVWGGIRWGLVMLLALKAGFCLNSLTAQDLRSLISVSTSEMSSRYLDPSA